MMICALWMLAGEAAAQVASSTNMGIFQGPFISIGTPI